MKSPTPKVLHRIGGRTLLDHAIDTAQALNCERIVVVVGAHSPQVGEHARKRLGEGATVLQDPPQGTGHAVLAAREALADFDGDVVVTFADCPLLSAPTIEPLFDLRAKGADVAVLGFEAANPGAYGRLILAPGPRAAAHRRGQGRRRHRQAGQALQFRRAGRRPRPAVRPAGQCRQRQRQPGILPDRRGRPGPRPVELSTRAAFAPEASVQGVNSQAELAAAEAVWQAARRNAFLVEGVTMPAPETVHLSWDTQAGRRRHGRAVRGVRARRQRRDRRGDQGLQPPGGRGGRRGALIGPYARLRPAPRSVRTPTSATSSRSRRSRSGRAPRPITCRTWATARSGPKANIGAGTIFCNYDGFDKFETHVGAGAFIGSNTALVAPVRVGDGAMTGSGSVITKDVEDGALALGRAPQSDKPGWATKFRAMKAAQKAKTQAKKDSK
jgi:bifunctional UDP-N-acetylglucosamine pyrophosphorylase/glucosamine-1-phosphate N-acetyltransferase